MATSAQGPPHHEAGVAGWFLFMEVVSSVAVVCTLAFVGVVLTKKGIITRQLRAGLAELNMNAAVPALLFTRMLDCEQCGRGGHLPPGCQRCEAFGVTLVESWVLLVAPFCVVGLGLLLGKIVLFNFPQCPPDCRSAVLAAVAFPNATGLPIILLSVLYEPLRNADIFESPLRYLPSYLIVYPVLQWSIGAWLFGVGEGPSEPAALSPPTERPVPPAAERRTELPNGWGDIELAPVAAAAVSRRDRAETGGTLQSAAASAAVRRASVDAIGTWVSMATSAMLPTARAAVGAATRAVAEAPVAVIASEDRGQAPLRTVSRQLLRPPILAVLAGVLVGLCPLPWLPWGWFDDVPALRGLLVDLTYQDDRAPLRWLFKALYQLGSAVVTLNMLILGSSLAEGTAFSTLPISLTAEVATARLVLQPTITFLVVQMLRPFLMLDLELQRRNAVWLVVLVVSSTPTANNIQAMAQLGRQNPAPLSAMVFLQYLCAPLVLTLSLIMFLASSPQLAVIGVAGGDGTTVL